MHEMGHNFGLLHGGSDNYNFKPNYYSIMNYMYELRGLSDIGNNNGDRYYYCRYVTVDLMSENSLYKQYFTAVQPVKDMIQKELQRGPFPGDFFVDYSDGTGGSINENSINESTGINRPGSAAIDYNGNGNTIDAGFSIDLNNYQLFNNLNDFKDWANINIVFHRKPGAYSAGMTKNLNNNQDFIFWPDVLGDDRQTICEKDF